MLNQLSPGFFNRIQYDWLNLEMRKNVLGQMLCPKCNKADKVDKIRYGDGLPMAKQIVSDAGDTTYPPIINGHYNAGTCM